ncbi:MAG: hypothetical protein WA126_01575, partial [Thermodesulfovibrionales bacterium]
ITGGNIGLGMITGAVGGAFLGAASGYGIVAEIGAGAASGGIMAGFTGGNVGQGMLYGAAGAAAGYGLGLAAKDIGNANFQFAARVAGGGLISGGIAELSGGKFSQGFASGAVGAAMGYGIGKWVDNNKQTQAQTDLTVNHSDAPTSAEEQKNNIMLVAELSTPTPEAKGYTPQPGWVELLKEIAESPVGRRIWHKLTNSPPGTSPRIEDLIKGPIKQMWDSIPPPEIDRGYRNPVCVRGCHPNQ